MTHKQYNWRDRRTRRHTARSDSIDLVIVTQNIRGAHGSKNVDGTRDLAKLERITKMMPERKIDILFTKKLIFLAIPVNTVLHGCESWALKAQHINKLQVFFHRSIRRILGINMHRVEHDHIKNEHIHNFFGVADIIDEIRLRQFHWLGKLGRQPDSLPTKRLLSAWAPAARRGGAQFITLRKTYCDTLESILGEDCMKSGSGNLKEWLSLAQSPAKWKHLEFIFKKTQREIQMDSGLGALAGPRNR
jgi:hypothetical protein